MKTSSKLTLLSLSVAMAVACGEAAKPAPPAATPAPAAAAPVAAAEFGVPECDDYINKYMACVESKVPEAQRAMMKQSFDQAKDAWKKTAVTPEGKAGLATACTQAKEGAKAAMSAYGCTF